MLSKKVQELLNTLTPDEQKYLSDCFEYLILEDVVFGYSLMGNKPMSWLIAPKKFVNIIQRLNSSFPNYTFLKADNPCTDNTLLVFINKKNLQETFNIYRADFELVLNKKLNEQDLFAAINKQAFLTGFLKSHNGLIGTLLGYGRDNAWQFHELTQKGVLPGTIMDHFCCFSEKIKIFTLVIKNSVGIKKSFFSLLSLPNFCVDSSSIETKQLQKEYKQCRKRLLKYYKTNPFLAGTLEILTNNSRKTSIKLDS